jgi:hypothetical protein
MATSNIAATMSTCYLGCRENEACIVLWMMGEMEVDMVWEEMVEQAGIVEELEGEVTAVVVVVAEGVIEDVKGDDEGWVVGCNEVWW